MSVFSKYVCDVCFHQIFPTTLLKFKMKIKQVLKKTLDFVLGCKEHLRFAKMCSERKKERKGN